MKNKNFILRKSNGALIEIDVTIIPSEKGDIRSINIYDHEAKMAGEKWPSDVQGTIMITANDEKVSVINSKANKKEMKKFANFLLKALS